MVYKNSGAAVGSSKSNYTEGGVVFESSHSKIDGQSHSRIARRQVNYGKKEELGQYIFTK